MRFIFKTDYEQDIRILKHSGYWWSYGALLALLCLVPFVFGSYMQSQIVFVFIYAIVGIALMILTGFTGQGSIGHAAFLAIGAYTAGAMQSKGVGFFDAGILSVPVSIPIWKLGTINFTLPMPHLGYFIQAGLLTGLIGALVGFPALRLHGIYLVIATISFGFIVEEILARWESVTNGNEGMKVKALEFGGLALPRDGAGFYFLCLAALIVILVAALNIMRSPTGRAFIAIRDSETASKSMGIDLAAYKVRAFAISATITGLAGVLYAHKLSFISPEMFTLLLSIEFIMVIIIGGAFGLHGAILGAIFMVMIDPLLTALKDDVPAIAGSVAAALGAGKAKATAVQDSLARIGSAAGLKGAIYGIIIMIFILFEPLGLYGRWLKIKLFFQLFPLYKKATFRRQKTYVKSERNR